MYGIILSSFSFSSFICKPLLGKWCDNHQCFKGPYKLSLGLAALGGLVYFLAAFAPKGNWSVSLILLGRLLGGVGEANNTLGFTYVAQTVDKAVLTQASAILSVVRVIGMAVAPALNIFLDAIDIEIFGLAINPLNSVGLLLVAANLIALAVIYRYLLNPKELARCNDEEETTKLLSIIDESKDDDTMDDENESEGYWQSMFCVEILVPIMAIFSLNVNFQLMETGMAPAASDALGWGPVEVSAIFGGNSLMILLGILWIFRLSSQGIVDELLLGVGLIVSTIGYGMMYLLWANPTTPFLFCLPVVVSTLGFPFLCAPNRSLFTMAVDSKPALRHHQGFMQALLSMIASVAGFTAPGVISSFILRNPDQVAGSEDGREFTALALLAPGISLLTLVGLMYSVLVKHSLSDDEDTEEEEEEGEVDETTGLIYPHRHSVIQSHHKTWRRSSYVMPDFSPKVRADRRSSAMIMGIPQFTYEDYAWTYREIIRRQSTGGEHYTLDESYRSFSEHNGEGSDSPKRNKRRTVLF